MRVTSNFGLWEHYACCFRGAEIGYEKRPARIVEEASAARTLGNDFVPKIFLPLQRMLVYISKTKRWENRKKNNDILSLLFKFPRWVLLSDL